MNLFIIIIYTIDRKIFALKIIRPLNFRVKYFVVRWFHNVAHIHVLIFHAFDFRRSACGRKYSNGKNFSIYGTLYHLDTSALGLEQGMFYLLGRSLVPWAFY